VVQVERAKLQPQDSKEHRELIPVRPSVDLTENDLGENELKSRNISIIRYRRSQDGAPVIGKGEGMTLTQRED
jgi:hypothetical protein